MWIFDKLFNRKIEGKSSLDDLAENVVVNKETNTTEIVGNLDVSGNITKNGQPIGGGTKLYKHYLYDSSMDYKFILITTNSQPIDFSVIDTFEKLYNYLLTQNVIRFIRDTGESVQYDYSYEHCFYCYDIQNTGTITELSLGLIDDWSLVNTTDTVTEL